VESVRLATPDDLATVTTLVGEFVAEQRGQRGGAVWAAQQGDALATEASLRTAIDDPTQAVMLGAFHDAVVGVLMARLDALDDGSLLAVIGALYVHPEGREVGVGSALIESAAAWAAAKGCCGLDATVLPGNRGGKNFFEMHGMVARAIQVHRSVGER
jgi:GNAT superfamily N-acetyltransferase